MPIMATHNEQSFNLSPTNSIFYNNAAAYSPELPTATNNRKRKQQQQKELQYSDLNQQGSINGVLDNIYQSYNQSWNSHNHEDFIVPLPSSSSSTTTTYHQNSGEEINTSSHVMNNSWHSSNSTTNDSFYDNQDSFLNHQHQKSSSSSDGVGENNEIQILNLDQEPPFHFTDRDANSNTRNTLNLNDLGGNQTLIHQAWSPQHQQPFNTGGGSPGFFTPGFFTPGFFTPGFLESLREDENESLESFPFHVPTNSNSYNTTTRNWGSLQHSSEDIPAKTAITMEHNTSLAHERAFASQQQQQTNDIPSLGLFHSGPSSSSPLVSSFIDNKFTTTASTLKPIVEDDLVMDHRRSLQVGAMNARLLLQHAVNAAKMKPIIRNYLSGGGDEKTVVILTSKVAQKSYGTEKRFLCPPPTAIVVGASWWTNNGGQKIENTNEILKRGQQELNPPKLTVIISGETSIPQSGQIEWYTVSGVTVGQTGHIKSQQQHNQSALQQSEHPSRFRSSSESRSDSIDWYHNHHQVPLAAGKCVSKHLYINDADEKRKRVECMIKIQLANGFQLGTLASKGIKVISKPSKKRQSVKNMELCIHHGTTVSLFNRIRSQTVSTKYLGVSTAGAPFSYPGQKKIENKQSSAAAKEEGTCFIARTTCWDPFVIWVVDTTRTPGDAKETDTPEDFIGPNSTFIQNIPYPPPPAIALKNKTGQLIPIHYNQHVVLQCLTTGLVSPVMIIRKVDKASTVVGGALCTDDLNLLGGGEYGDEVLGGPVSQLHKVAFQIVQDPANANQRQQQNYLSQTPSNSMLLPRSSNPVSYLACLNDMVFMHKTSDPRKPIHHPPLPTISTSSTVSSSVINWDVLDMFDVTAQEEKIIRKRRVSGTGSPILTSEQSILMMQQIYNTNTSDDHYSLPIAPPPAPLAKAQKKVVEYSRKSSVSSTGSGSGGGRRSSVSNNLNQSLGAYWNEDVSDAAVWTIVGTDCVTYKFLSPLSEDNNTTTTPPIHNPFPSLISFTTTGPSKAEESMLSLHGENFSRDIQVWFGDQKSIQTEYCSRELLICKVPSRNELLETKNVYKEIPILLVRRDGTICKTNKFYPL